MEINKNSGSPVLRLNVLKPTPADEEVSEVSVQPQDQDKEESRMLSPQPQDRRFDDMEESKDEVVSSGKFLYFTIDYLLIHYT